MLTDFRLIRRQKSSTEAKGPFSFRSVTMFSAAPAPTFLMSCRPKRIVWPLSFSDVSAKLASLWLMSGGKTAMPSLAHSAKAAAMRGWLPDGWLAASASSAVRYSAG